MLFIIIFLVFFCEKYKITTKPKIHFVFQKFGVDDDERSRENRKNMLMY